MESKSWATSGSLSTLYTDDMSKLWLENAAFKRGHVTFERGKQMKSWIHKIENTTLLNSASSGLTGGLWRLRELVKIGIASQHFSGSLLSLRVLSISATVTPVKNKLMEMSVKKRTQQTFGKWREVNVPLSCQWSYLKYSLLEYIKNTALKAN